MMLRLISATVAACLLVTPLPCSGQASYELTFKVPLNLTQISPSISKVAVSCIISSPAIISNARGQLGKQEELSMTGTGGQLVRDVNVVILASGLDNPVGKAATYSCTLSGFSTVAGRWDVFSATATIAEFRVTATPLPLEGNFPWW